MTVLDPASPKALRRAVPRTALAHWRPSASRAPLETVRALLATLRPELRELRAARMTASPFAFLRGAAGLMVSDLATLPRSGFDAQLCGDAHVANFGGYVSPEGTLLFDVVDFDETARGPWEFDLARLGASIELAGREDGLPRGTRADAVRAAAEAYRRRMRDYAQRSPLEVWNDRIAIAALLRERLTRRDRRAFARAIREAPHRTGLAMLPRLTETVEGRPRLREEPPLLYHAGDAADIARTLTALTERYRETLRTEARILLDRYRPIDVALKVVGVGSVGTFCALALLVTPSGDELIVQLKEARASVLEGGEVSGRSHAQRVVEGQRAIQGSADPFLGWTSVDGLDVYVRHFRDERVTIDLMRLDADALRAHAEHCGWALARAHARTGAPGPLGAYLGGADVFDEALTRFAARYADLTERDHAAVAGAHAAGILTT